MINDEDLLDSSGGEGKVEFAVVAPTTTCGSSSSAVRTKTAAAASVSCGARQRHATLRRCYIVLLFFIRNKLLSEHGRISKKSQTTVARRRVGRAVFGTRTPYAADHLNRLQRNNDNSCVRRSSTGRWYRRRYDKDCAAGERARGADDVRRRRRFRYGRGCKPPPGDTRDRSRTRCALY